jgi:Amt family ammonium transporter
MATTFTDEDIIAAVNGVWILVAGVLCFLLQAGFGLLEVGMVRSKNAQNIMIKNLLDVAVAALSYYAVGYGLAYGEGGSPFCGQSYFFLNGTEDYIGWFFQFVFAGTTATIVSGAVAERCQFRAYLIYSAVLTAFIYPVVSHWIWSADGWMAGKVLDFAGGGAVHGVGGTAALSAAWILGPRIGRFSYDEETKKWTSHKIPGHNLVLSALGGFILWMGFFPFNGGSGLDIGSVDGALITGRVVVVTTLAGASGGVTMLAFGRIKSGEWDMMLSLNGVLAGMIASCSGVNTFHPTVALFVGFSGSWAYYLQDWVTEYVFHIDDPLGAAALHMGAGFWGCILSGLLANDEYVGEEMAGLFYGGSIKTLGWQLIAILAYFGWAFGTCSIMFGTLMYLGWFRVSEEEESEGMDLTHHGGSAYNIPYYAGEQKDKSVASTKHLGAVHSDDDSGDASPTTDA